MNYTRHSTIDHYLNKVRLHAEPYSAVILGEEIIIFPNVMSPKYDRSAQIFINLLPSQKGKRFIDVGCGSGIVSVFVAKQSALQVTAVDINPHAVENTRANLKIHGTVNPAVFESDLFEHVEGMFDTIFFNAPFHGNKPLDILELGTSDPEYQTLRRFFSDVGQYLATDGTIYLGFSNMGDNQLLIHLIESNNLKIINRQEQENGDWTAYLYAINVK